MNPEKVIADVRFWRDTCARYEAEHRREYSKSHRLDTHAFEAAEYHRGGKEAFHRVLEELGKLNVGG